MRTELSIVEVGQCIRKVRGMFVMLDFDLARFYEIETKRLNQQVERNLRRFPLDFAFRLLSTDYDLVLNNDQRLKRSNYLPFAFTQAGAVMVSSVLRTAKAEERSVTILRAFAESANCANGYVEKRLDDFGKKLQALVESQLRLEQRFEESSPKLPEHIAAEVQPSIPNDSVDEVKKLVATAFDIEVPKLSAHTRTAKISRARQVAMYVVRTKYGVPYRGIGEAFGNLDHTTVMHACRKVETLIATDPRFRELIRFLLGSLNQCPSFSSRDSNH